VSNDKRAASTDREETSGDDLSSGSSTHESSGPGLPEPSNSEHLESFGSDLPEQMLVRREKRAKLLATGREAYPVTVPRTHTIAQVRAGYPSVPAGEMTGDTVCVAGRVIFIRNTGKLCFANLHSGSGETLQAMISLDRVGEQRLADWKADADIGDHVWVRGEVGASRRGELSVFVAEWGFAAKALRPLPVAHKPLNEETRVRRRYLDLIVREEARQVARQRIATLASLRDSLTNRDYLEVETPILQTLHGGASARPFVTHMNAYDIDLYLRIAPELFLKRCVIGGIDRVFDINRNFRNEGADSTHSPEFGMLEFYQAYSDYNEMAVLTRELIQEAAMNVFGTLQVTHADGGTHDLSGEWEGISVYPALSAAIDEEIAPDTRIERLIELCEEVDIVVDPHWLPGRLVEELLEHHVVSNFTGPTFVWDYPVDTSPLVREHRSEPGVVEKWDLYVDGFELATGYSELVDPVIQRERLVSQASRAASGDDEAMRLDEDFLEALEHGMPPSGGVGVGIDRLLMALTGLGIRDTILFPLVKPTPELVKSARHSAASQDAEAALVVRPARATDVPDIRELVQLYAPDRTLLAKQTVTLYEDVQDFVVAVCDGEIVATGALHVLWEDLGEVRTLAVNPAFKGKGYGSAVLRLLIERARELGLKRIFCLTFEVDFFSRFGFRRMVGDAVTPEVVAELTRSGDEGVAQFLDLERVRPNTLGNERLLLQL
jgi:lysyl-tRNA synthetase class 2